MFFEEYGSRENRAVLFLHGAGNVYSFARQYGYADRFHLIVPHLLGNGEEAEKEYSLEGNLDGILEILHSFGGGPVAAAGFSLGAQLVIPLLCREPALFDRALMVSPWILKEPRSLRWIGFLQELLFPLDKWPAFVRMQARSAGLDAEQTKASVRQGARLRRDNIRRYVEGGVDIDDYPQFSQLEIPMLALCGDRENEKLMVASVHALAQRNQNCRALVLEDHAHDIPFRRPEEFNEIFERFMASGGMDF